MNSLFTMIADWFCETALELATKFAKKEFIIRYVHQDDEWKKLGPAELGIRVVPESLFQHYLQDVVKVSFDYGFADGFGNLIPNEIACPKGWIPDRYFDAVRVDGLGHGYIHMWSRETANVYELMFERAFNRKITFDMDKYAIKVQNYLHCGFMQEIGILHGHVVVIKGMHGNGMSFALKSRFPERMWDASIAKVSTCLVDVDGRGAIMKGDFTMVEDIHELAAMFMDRETMRYDSQIVDKIWELLKADGCVFVCGEKEMKCIKSREEEPTGYEYGMAYECVFGIKGYDSEACFWKNHIHLSGQNAALSAHVLDPDLFGAHASELCKTASTREGFFSLMRGPHATAMECFGHVYDTRTDPDTGELIAEGSEHRFKAMKASLPRKLVRLDLPGFTCYAAVGIGMYDHQVIMGTGKYLQWKKLLEKNPDLKDTFMKRDPDQGWGICPMTDITCDPSLPRNAVLVADYHFHQWNGDQDGDLYVVFLGKASGLQYRKELPEECSFNTTFMEIENMSMWDRCMAATESKHFGKTVMQAYRAMESGNTKLSLEIQWFLVQAQLDGVKDGEVVDYDSTMAEIRSMYKFNKYSDHYYYVLNGKIKPASWKQPSHVVRTEAIKAVIPYVDEFFKTAFKWDIKAEKKRWNDFSAKAHKISKVPGKGWENDLREFNPAWDTILGLRKADDIVSARAKLREHLNELAKGKATHEYLAAMSQFMAELWGTGRYYQNLSNSLTEQELRFAAAYIGSFGPNAKAEFTKAIEALVERPVSDVTDWTDGE